VILISIHNTTRRTTETVRNRKTEVQRRSNAIPQQTVVRTAQCADVQTRNLNELWYKTEEKIKKGATITVGYAQKQEKREWFDEEFATVNEKKRERKLSKFETEPELQSYLQ
jgi:hypothetical protein